MSYLADYLNALTGTELAEIMAAFAAKSSVQILAQLGVASTHTGDTSEFTHFTLPLLGYMNRPNDALRILSSWTFSAHATFTKIPRIRLGGISGAAYLSTTQTTNTLLQTETIIRNRGSVSSQFGFSGSSPFGGAVATYTTSAINMAVAQDLLFTSTANNAGESVTLEGYTVEYLRAP
jgi:hypothetical protein